MSQDRNKPCPCKSGNKVKKCCIKTCCEECLFSKEHLGAVEKSWSLKHSLVREGNKHHLPNCSSLLKFNPKTVIICGNGSVYWKDPDRPNHESNAWDIVQKCVDRIKASPEGRGPGIPSQKDNFLHWLASTEKMVAYFDREYPPHSYKYEKVKQVHAGFRIMLGRSFKGASVHLRSLCCFHCENCHSVDFQTLNDCGVLTLNWDGAIRKLPNTIELHGICDMPKTMVLPNQDFMRLLPKDMMIEQGFEGFATAHRWLTGCENIIIWGCQLNDYDAIISAVISIFCLANVQGRINLFVSNPDAEARIRIEEKLQDYFPLATICKCLNEINF